MITDTATFQDFLFSEGTFPIAEVSKSADGACIVSGLASVETIDNLGDLVDPTTFDIPAYLESGGTLLFNHRRSEQIGRVTKALSVELLEGDDDSVFYVVSLEDGEIVGTVPKDQFGDDVSGGTRGLWVEAEVTNPTKAAEVRNGTLRSFSWRGKTFAQKLVDAASGYVGRLLRGVTLEEISLVVQPANRNALVAVAKSASADPSDPATLLDELQRMAVNLVAMLAQVKEQQEKLLKDARRGYSEYEPESAEVSKDQNSIFDDVFAQSGDCVINHFDQ